VNPDSRFLLNPDSRSLLNPESGFLLKLYSRFLLNPDSHFWLNPDPTKANLGTGCNYQKNDWLLGLRATSLSSAWNKNRKEDRAFLLSVELVPRPPPPANTAILATSLPFLFVILLSVWQVIA